MKKEYGKWVFTPYGRVHVYDLGPINAPVLVLIHGVPSPPESWKKIALRLSAENRVIIPSLLGSAWSGNPKPKHRGLWSCALALNEVLNQLNVKKAQFVASDVGGAVTTHFADLFPQKVEGILFLSGLLLKKFWPAPIIKLMRIPIIGEILCLIPSRFHVKKALNKGIVKKESITKSLIKDYRQPIKTLPLRFRFLKFIRSMNPSKVEMALRRIAQKGYNFPISILWGKLDPWQNPSHGQQVHELLENKGSCQFRSIENCGHFITHDAPKEIFSEIKRLRSLKEVTS